MTTAPGVVGSTALAELAGSIRPLDDGAMQAARERLDRLTKPPGSLGRLETLAVQLAGIRARLVTAVERPAIVAPTSVTHSSSVHHVDKSRPPARS